MCHNRVNLIESFVKQGGLRFCIIPCFTRERLVYFEVSFVCLLEQTSNLAQVAESHKTKEVGLNGRELDVELRKKIRFYTLRNCS